MGEINVDAVNTEVVAAEQDIVVHEGASNPGHFFKHVQIAVHVRVAALGLYYNLAAIVIFLQPSSEDFLGMLDTAPSSVKPCGINIVAANAHIIVQHVVDLCFIFKCRGCCTKADIGYLCSKTFYVDIFHFFTPFIREA